jgi:FAD/FMN-containing dehydrogenase
LTPLFVGSQGTLGIVTEAILKVEPYQPRSELVVAGFDDMSMAVDALKGLRALDPSALEMIDKNLIEFASKEQNYVFPAELVDKDFMPAVVLFIEFDDHVERARHKKAKKAQRIVEALTSHVVVSREVDEQERLWAIRHSAATVVNYNHSGKVAVPIIEDASVPHDRLLDLIEGIYDLFARHHLTLAVWGHAGDANLHIHPLLDLSKLTDRQKVFRLMDEYYRMVVKLGGSIAAEHNDGRLRVPFVKLQTGEDMVGLFTTLKLGFDPHGILNPGVKTGTDMKQLVDMLRKEYSIVHLSDHLPRT